MKFLDTGIEGLLLVELEIAHDGRGHFARTFCEQEFAIHGLETRFPQTGTAFNLRAGTVRGLHFQREPHGEAKLIRCTRGAILDVVIDVRPGSPSYLRNYQARLAEDGVHQLYVPRGFAHGYQTLTDATEVHYMMSSVYAAAAATGLRWNDPAIGIEWPLPVSVISDRDSGWPLLSESGRP